MGKRVAIGIGNYLMRDDGIGPKVIEQISLRGLDKNLDSNQGFEDIATDGLRLLRHFSQETEKIVIIDSAYMGQQPGTIRVFSLNQIENQKQCQHISTHEGDIINLINLAKKLDYPVPEIIFVAIEPAQVSMGIELSACLKNRIDELIQCVLKELAH